MNTLKKLTLVVALLSFSSLMLAGCSDDKDKKVEKKNLTIQQQMGKEAAESMKKPAEVARQTAEEASSKADQALKAVTDETKKPVQETGDAHGQASGKEKKKLEGC